MTESLQPTSGTLEAVIIHACKVHDNTCSLRCPERQVEDLGQIAAFDHRPPLIERIIRRAFP